MSSSNSTVSSTPSSSVPPSTSAPADTTTSTAPKPTSTSFVTDKTTVTNGKSVGGTTVVVKTVTNDGTTSLTTYTGPPASISGPASSSAAAISNDGNNGGSSGLSTGATTAIAVIIPVAVVALLVGLGIFFYRKRKQKKEDEDQRRKAVEEYNYNPNHDPTLPAIGSDTGAQMSEDHSSGYRGWGATASSGRKMSTTLSGGHTQQLSDSGNSDPMMNYQRDTYNSDDMNALGVGAGAGAMMGAGAAKAGGGLHRGPSNASSAYSAGDHSDAGDDVPPVPVGSHGDEPRYELPAAYNPSNGYGYGQHGPYGDGSYGGGGAAGMPVVQDLNARRNTRISPGGAYQQGNSGIAQNF